MHQIILAYFIQLAVIYFHWSRSVNKVLAKATEHAVKAHSHGPTASVTTSIFSCRKQWVLWQWMDLFTQTLASATSAATCTSIVKSFFDVVVDSPCEWTLKPTSFAERRGGNNGHSFCHCVQSNFPSRRWWLSAHCLSHCMHIITSIICISTLHMVMRVSDFLKLSIKWDKDTSTVNVHCVLEAIVNFKHLLLMWKN